VSTKSVLGTTATGRPRNRSWPEALKREIVAASYAPGWSVSMVARHYDVNANQVFSWRKRYGEGSRPPSDPSSAQLIPVMITAEQHGVTVQPSTVVEKIEINVAGKYRVRIGNGFDGQALRRVLDVLERR
jgi:transposase